jgi:hypothetical protein
MQAKLRTRFNRLHTAYAKREAKIKQARRGPPPAGPTDVLQAVLARIFAFADVVLGHATLEAVPLRCLDGRPFDDKAFSLFESAEGRERAAHLLLADLAGLPAGVCGGRGPVLFELFNRVFEMDPATGVWPAPCGQDDCRCNHRPPDQWIEDAAGVTYQCHYPATISP